MENKEYSGWNLFDKVIIVAKEKTRYCWDTHKQEFEGYQGYTLNRRLKCTDHISFAIW